MYSNLLNCEIETMETEDGLFIITHDTLRRCVRGNSRIKVVCKPLILSPEMCGFEATATDTETGREEVEIGESNPLNLKNAISKENPIIMAQYRAYDRAVIQLLDLPQGKVYSNNEIQGAKFKKTNNESATYKEAYNCEIRPENGKFAIYDKETNAFISKKNGSHFLFDTEEKCIEQLKIREEKRLAQGLKDDEVILIGAFKNKKYGEVKDLDEFKDFLNKLKNSSLSYGDETQKRQLEILKSLAS